jgi:NADH-quinone oxidoreductase subunit J
LLRGAGAAQRSSLAGGKAAGCKVCAIAARRSEVISDAAYTALFYVIASMALALAIAVTTSRRLLRAAVYLMGVLLMSAGLYVMLNAEFLAGVQILVYVGGIVVLIVFAVMLTRSAELQLDRPPLHRKILAILASIAFATMTGWICWISSFGISEKAVVPQVNTEAIGTKLLGTGSDGYVLPFEIISVLLLAAMIGGIVVARKTPPPQQPFTSGGDLPGEAQVSLSRSQRPAAVKKEGA